MVEGGNLGSASVLYPVWLHQRFTIGTVARPFKLVLSVYRWYSVSGEMLETFLRQLIGPFPYR